jgi:hypothetical protein
MGFVRQAHEMFALLLQPEHAGEEDRVPAEADGVADPAGSVEPGAGPVAVAKGVHGDARFAGGGLWAGGAAPGLPAADERRLAGAAFGGPAQALGAHVGAGTRKGAMCRG